MHIEGETDIGVTSMPDIESAATAPVTFNSGGPDIHSMWGPLLDAGTDSEGILYSAFTPQLDDEVCICPEGDSATIAFALYLNSPDSDGDRLLDGPSIRFTDASQAAQNLFASYSIYHPTTVDELKYEDLTEEFYIGEQRYGTNPLNRDSDGDGLWDGPSVGGQPGERAILFPGAPGIAAQTAYTLPTNFDTDSDGLSDGQEVIGWTVTIIYEKTKEKVPGMERQVRSNPLIVDTDSDGVSDFNEFTNSSDPMDIDGDTDNDHILDRNEAQGELTQVEGKDPEIVGAVQAYTVVEWGEFAGLKYPKKWSIRVTVTVRDNAGLDYVTISIEGQSPQTERFATGVLEKTVSKDFAVDWLRSLTVGYDIHVTVADVNGNGNKTKTHMDGAAEGLAKALVSWFMAFVKAVAELASKALEWIWNAIKTIIDKVMKPLYDLFNNFMRRLTALVNDIFTKPQSLEFFTNAFISIFIGLSPPDPFLTACLGMGLAIFAIEILYFLVTFAIPAAKLVDFVTSLIINQGMKQIFAISSMAVLMATILNLIGPKLYSDTAIGLSLAETAMGIAIALVAAALRKPGYLIDAFAIALSIAGLLITLYIPPVPPIVGLGVAIIGLLLSGVGVLLAFAGPDIPGTAGKIDEFLDIILFGFASYDVAKKVTG